MKKNLVQVEKEHYYSEYDSLSRFTSYYSQCKTALDLKPESVLEIGIGNKTASNYLKEMGLKVTTCDFDKNLEPDIVGDIRDLKNIKDNSFDLVMACEVLEHLPWEDIDKALAELKRVSKKYVLISVPWSGWFVNFNFTFPYIQKIFQRDYLNIGFIIPRFYANIKWKGEHYWEIGSKDYPIKRIRNKFQEYFKLEKDFQVELNRYHHYFILSN